MKYYTVLFFMFIITSAVYADDYIIKLSPKEDTTLTKRNFYFDAVEDAREKNQGKRIVGHFGKNDKTTAVLDTNPEVYSVPQN